ncbi:hypothetical protein [Falsiroseomonas tokyonensis]|uniref:Uncharacterized protein n=1 Tax=Falsiroseomonas tokyonensis TaxID=430521 RepID=A0ABV7BS44_9PROT|nr:hypothetical protein [Falsiroseomonas tokyonensis]MBU8538365.1 hypothetical protein [Falsiroseomonas tokyonensis]
MRAGPDFAHVADFLARPAVPRRPPVNLLGRVARLEGGLVHGWAADLLPNRPVRLRLVAGATPLGARRAQLFHPGAASAGFVRGSCGFRLRLPEVTPGPLRLVAEGTNIALPDPDGLLAP